MNYFNKIISSLFTFSISFITIIKFRLIILSFIAIYLLFFAIMSYVLYKSYLLALERVNDFVYSNMSKDISRLNWNYPISNYVENIPSINHINNVYNSLGITDYNDYIYNISKNSQVLHTILDKNSQLQSNTSSIVLADIVYQNSQLFADLSEEVLKRFIKLSLPLAISALLLGGTYLLENVNLVNLVTIGA